MNADAKRQRIVLCLMLACAVGLAWALLSPVGRTNRAPVKPAVPNVQPAPPVCPPDCPNCPRKPRRPWGPRFELAVAGQAANPEPAVDLLAVPDRKPNIRSRGLGCCVFRSLDYAAHWQSEPALFGFPEWMVSTGIEGGGWPQKVDQLVPRIAQSRGLPTPGFIQYEGPNYAEAIELILKTGRVACVTWQANHMLNCVHLDATSCGIVDNNAPERVQWFSREDGLRRIGAPKGQGWVVALTSPGPPPPPRGRVQVRGKDCLCSSACTCGCNQGLPCACQGARPWVPVPVAPAPAKLAPEYKGVIWTAPPSERWTVCGQDTSADLIEAELKDDSARPYLTVIGAKADRDRVLAALGALSGDYRIHGYEPGDWAVNGFGFVTTGKPTLYLQDATGKVILRRDSAEDLAELAGALRRADPAYDPSQDPDGRAVVPGLPSWLTGERALVGLLGVGGVAGAWWLMSRTSQTAPMPVQPQSQPVSDLARRIEAQLQAQIAAELMARLGGQQPPRSN